MDVLPVKSLREEDQILVGKELVNLAKLAQAEFPVASGVVVIPPQIKLKTILEHFEYKDKEVFEQSLEIIKKEVAQIPPPKELEQALVNKRIDVKKTWLKLLEVWINEVRSRIWREGFSKNLTKNLTAQPVFFIKKLSSSGSCYYDYEEDRLRLKTLHGQITPDQLKKLADLVVRADKKLFLPNIYYFIIDGSLKFVKIAPFTQHEIPETSEFSRQTNGSTADIVQSKKETAVKVFLKLSTDLRITHNIDGVVISAELVKDQDQKILQIVEAATSLGENPLIFKLPDLIDSFGGVRGTLRLIHDQKLLKQEVEAFLFARNKKRLLNTQIAIPFIRSVNEFVQIKRDLASLGVSRKGSLKLWLELALPENLLNLEEYLLIGVDGVILNLDELAAWIGGFDPSVADSVFYKRQIKALIKLLENCLKVLHKSKVATLASGSLTLHDEVISFLIDKGIWAIEVDFSEVSSIHDYIDFHQRRNFRAKLPPS